MVAVYALDAEFSRPLYVFLCISSHEFLQSGGQKESIVCSYKQNGRSCLGILDVVNSPLSAPDIPFTDINNISSGINCFYIEGASAVHPLSSAKVTLDDHKSEAVDFKIIWSSSADISECESHFSLLELIELPTEVPSQNAYAYFYPPSYPIYQASQDEKPPLSLESYGGKQDS